MEADCIYPYALEILPSCPKWPGPVFNGNKLALQLGLINPPTNKAVWTTSGAMWYPWSQIHLFFPRSISSYFPLEILLHIFLSGPLDIPNMRCVSQAWREVIDANELVWGSWLRCKYPREIPVIPSNMKGLISVSQKRLERRRFTSWKFNPKYFWRNDRAAEEERTKLLFGETFLDDEQFIDETDEDSYIPLRPCTVDVPYRYPTFFVNAAIYSGRYCYEAHILERSSMSVGWAGCRLRNTTIGQDYFSWGYNGLKQMKHGYDNRTAPQSQSYGKDPWTVGDVIGVYIDLLSQPPTIFWTRNGVHLGPGFSPAQLRVSNGPFFPAVSFTLRGKLQFVFDSSRFRYPPVSGFSGIEGAEEVEVFLVDKVEAPSSEDEEYNDLSEEEPTTEESSGFLDGHL